VQEIGESQIEVHQNEGPDFNLAKLVTYLSIAPPTKRVLPITNHEERSLNPIAGML
jgi:hypothetical protein